MTDISAIIISRNEELNIARCIASLDGIADEIIVVDSMSSDSTAQICREMGCKVVCREFTGFGAQRQFATSLASHRYVLSIDADEVLSPALQRSLRQLKSQGLTHRIYQFSRMNFYCGQPVKHCGWYPDLQIRLFDKSYAQWNLGDVFEKVVFPGTLRPEPVDGDILHYRCVTPKEYHDKVIDHARIGAKVLATTRRSVGPAVPVLKGLKSWFECYILRGGIFDGPEGRAISREEYLSTVTAYRLARKLLKDNGKA